MIFEIPHYPLHITVAVSNTKISMDSCRMNKDYCAVLEGKRPVRDPIKQFCAESDQPIVDEEIDPAVLHQEL
jgi:hypothetical protein